MSALVLTINAGSSSLKVGLFSVGAGDPKPVATGLLERIGKPDAALTLTRDGDRVAAPLAPGAATDQAGALTAALTALRETAPDARIAAVGHRIVHGGPDFDGPVALDADVLARLAAFESFAPLHQPHNLAGVRAAMAAFPDAAQIGAFDTAFHRDHPFVNDVFALPRRFHDKGVRRYGFHGLSYGYIESALAALSPSLHGGRVVVAHLGAGASMCALLAGRSVGSTMGFSALDGLPMGTRCGQLDPGVLLYLMQVEGMDADAISDLLYRESGLLGLSGLSGDMRTLLAAEAGNDQARQALDYFVFRIRRELGALAAVLGGLDALVFTGGIGENAAPIRQRVCEGMDWLGLSLDRAANARACGLNEAAEISAPLSRARALVIPTDEELMIARAAAGVVQDRRGGQVTAAPNPVATGQEFS